jgi:hypothetical protein
MAMLLDADWAHASKARRQTVSQTSVGRLALQVPRFDRISLRIMHTGRWDKTAGQS